MRKVIVLAGPLMGAALLTGSPAKAELGCECVKLGAPPLCTSGVTQCMSKVGGICLAPCIYEPPKMTKRIRHAKKKTS